MLLSQVRELAAYVRARAAEQNRLALEIATVTSIQKVGMGDRYTSTFCSDFAMLPEVCASAYILL